jgi:serine/threonine protein kinase
MAPEQAKGRAADKRSDVWAFGCVLYEMLTGTRAFEGEDVSDTLAAVLRGEPDWNALPPTMSAQIRTLIRGCLEKDRKQRIADISTALFVMSEPAMASAARISVALPRPLAQRAMPFVATVLLSGVLVAAAVWLTMRPAAPPPPDPVRFTIAPPADLQLSTVSPGRDVAISPDGRHVVYTTGTRPSNTQLLIRAVDQLCRQAKFLASGDPRRRSASMEVSSSYGLRSCQQRNRIRIPICRVSSSVR